MPGFLSLYDTTERIDVAPGYWVEIKLHLSADEDDRVTRALSRSTRSISRATAQAVDENTRVESALDMQAMEQELLMAGIVSWNLTDRDDKPLELDPPSHKRRSLALLPSEPRGLVLRRLLEIQRERRARTRDATFRGADGGGDHAGELNGRAADPLAVPD